MAMAIYDHLRSSAFRIFEVLELCEAAQVRSGWVFTIHFKLILDLYIEGFFHGFPIINFEV